MGNPTRVKCGEFFGITYTGDFICARCYLEPTPEEALSFLPAADDLGQ
jgi:hypothetical protein